MFQNSRESRLEKKSFILTADEIDVRQMVGLTEWINELVNVSVESHVENPLEETQLLLEKSKGNVISIFIFWGMYLEANRKLREILTSAAKVPKNKTPKLVVVVKKNNLFGINYYKYFQKRNLLNLWRHKY